MLLDYFIFFILGLAVGSFLNVVIYRLETEDKIAVGRSRCPYCRRILAWYDLAPLLSFLILRGRCRYCRKPISWQYPLVELATGILFTWTFYFSLAGAGDFGGQFMPSLFYLLFIASSLIIIFVYDWKFYIIPDKVIFPAVAISLVYGIASGLAEFRSLWPRDFFVSGPVSVYNLSIFDFFTRGGHFPREYFIEYLLAACLAGGLFLTIVVLTRGEGMGGGDVKLAFLMGLVLGLGKILIALSLSFTIGAVYGIILILLRKKTLKSAIPFGPFLVIGTLIMLFLR